jgi:hypothetical protein
VKTSDTKHTDWCLTGAVAAIGENGERMDSCITGKSSVTTLERMLILQQTRIQLVTLNNTGEINV